MEKAALKKTKYSTNESILKIGYLAKAIDFAKWSVWPKTCEKPFYKRVKMAKNMRHKMVSLGQN